MSFLTLGSTFSSRIPSWSGHFIVPCTDSRSSVSDATKQPQNVSKPPPYIHRTFSLIFFECLILSPVNEELVWLVKKRSATVLSHLSKGHSYRSFRQIPIFFFISSNFIDHCWVFFSARVSTISSTIHCKIHLSSREVASVLEPISPVFGQ